MQRPLALLAVVLAVLLVSGQALAEKRVALVIGNSDYSKANMNSLPNPKNDAGDIAEVLKQQGFKLIGGGVQLDLNRQTMFERILEFGDHLGPDIVGLFYYAGHGIAVKRTNYLIPVDGGAKSKREVSIKMVAADYIMEQFQETGGGLNIMILDACRNTPGIYRGFRDPGVDGLAEMKAASGTMISYATQPGNLAMDGKPGDRNSPYAKALMEVMQTPGIGILQAFNQVSLKVKKTTNNFQVPWNTSVALEGDFYFAGHGESVQDALQKERIELEKDRLRLEAEQKRREDEGLKAHAELERERLLLEAEQKQREDERGKEQAALELERLQFEKEKLRRVKEQQKAQAELEIERLRFEAEQARKEEERRKTEAELEEERLRLEIEIEHLKQQQIAAVVPSPKPTPPPSQAQDAVGIFPGQTFRDCAECPEMVVIPAGSFRMGDLNGGGDSNEKPVHTVTIPRPFAVGKYEVTFNQWEACYTPGGCSHRPKDKGWGRDNRPAIYVSWDDAKEYVSWLSGKTGKQYRLLAEAEWEYVARAGTSTKWSCGSNESCVGSVAWYSGNSGKKTHPVGGKNANAFGLHDMLGNVWEWVADCGHVSYKGAPSDGDAWTSGGDCSERVLRGGSLSLRPRVLRSALRTMTVIFKRHRNIGFRVARDLSNIQVQSVDVKGEQVAVVVPPKPAFGVSGSEIPFIRAETGPVKVRPDATGGDYKVQLATVRSPERVEGEWTRLKRKHSDLLGKLDLSIVKADLGPEKGVFYRLRAGPIANEKDARALCAKLAERKVGCLIVRPQEK